MKNRFISSFAVLTLALAGAFSTTLNAQTTEEGSGPSEQPSAPMEMGQPEATQPPQYGQPAQPGEEAEEGGPSGEAPAKTDQGVGRISMIHGDVSTQRGDSGDWSAAVLNQPVVNGDKVSTAAGGRAEVQLDFANILRLGSNAQANLVNFTHEHIQVQLGQGMANYSVFNESEAEPEIDTPNVAIHPAHKDVILRVEVRPDGDTILIVRKGEAQISTSQGSTEVHTGEMATIRGSSEDAQYKISQAPERDDWDRWNSDRDRMVHSAKSWGHTNRYYTGSEDLDAHGRWESAPDYGEVWVPNEPEDWAPYRDGNWVWEPSYGWTWVGYEPWGWAPYHYGRWMMYGNSWAWWPGPVYGGAFYRPFWAPAYVSFFGFGGGWGVGYGWGGWGGFGWLPIGPCDPFFPWWGGYGRRFGVVNITNIHITNNRFGGIAPLHNGTRFSNLAHINDRRIGRAFSTVGAGKFGAGRVTAVAATHDQLRSARMMTGNMPVVPTRASLSASGRAAAPSTIHNSGAQRFPGTQNNIRQESFQQQTAHLQQSMQQHHFAPVAAGGRANSGAIESHGMAAAAGGKPSAGTPSSGRDASGREMNGGAARSAANQPLANGNRGRSDMRPFTPPNSTRSESTQPSRSFPERSMGPASPANRAEQASPSRSEPNRSGWRPFTPPSRSTESVARGGNSAAPAGRNESGTYWNRTAPSPNYSRGSGPSSYERGGSSRPQLNMRQPIVQPRSNGGYSEGSRGGYRGSPSYSAPRSAPSSPTYSTPRTAPSAPSAPAHRGYNGGPSAPSYGGGHSYSGAGSRSAPSYGGGGYSGGSHSAPRYGGGYSGGGSHSAPSYGGGRSYSGGGSHGTPSYGGGGSHSAPSSGGHSSGGGSSHSSGGQSSGGAKASGKHH